MDESITPRCVELSSTNNLLLEIYFPNVPKIQRATHDCVYPFRQHLKIPTFILPLIHPLTI